MKYCKNCSLKFDSVGEKCIFCNSLLQDVNEQRSSTFSNKKPKSYYIEKVKKIIAFALIVIFVVSIFIENYLYNDRHYWLLTLFSCFYIYFVSSVSLNVSKVLVAKIMNISFLTSLETIGVFYFFDEFNMKGFVFSYVYPGIILLSLVSIIVVFAITGKKRFHDQLIYIFINILWGLTPLIPVLCNIVNPTYISYICIAISALMLLGLILFSNKDTRDEFNRRFHF